MARRKADLTAGSFHRGTPLAQPLADRMRPRTPRRSRRPGASARPRQAAQPDGRGPVAPFDDPVGSARHRQDHDRAAARTRSRARCFESIAAVSAGRRRSARGGREARRGSTSSGKRTVVFIDEIHRWNRAQQDAILPHVESGLITLIGATTENPSFEVISPLLSRARVLVLQSADG